MTHRSELQRACAQRNRRYQNAHVWTIHLWVELDKNETLALIEGWSSDLGSRERIAAAVVWDDAFGRESWTGID